MPKHLKKYVVLIGLILSNGCGSVPKKPSIDSGIIISEINEIFYVNNQTGNEYSLPICIDGEVNPKLNKHIDHSNQDWNKVLLYIRLLENKLPRKAKEELKKFRVNFENLQMRLKAHDL